MQQLSNEYVPSETSRGLKLTTELSQIRILFDHHTISMFNQSQIFMWESMTKNSFLISLRKVQNLVPLACFLFGSDQPELNNYCPFSPGTYLHLSPPSMNLWDIWDFNPWWYFILIYPLSAPLLNIPPDTHRLHTYLRSLKRPKVSIYISVRHFIFKMFKF